MAHLYCLFFPSPHSECELLGCCVQGKKKTYKLLLLLLLCNLCAHTSLRTDFYPLPSPTTPLLSHGLVPSSHAHTLYSRITLSFSFTSIQALPSAFGLPPFHTWLLIAGPVTLQPTHSFFEPLSLSNYASTQLPAQ